MYFLIVYYIKSKSALLHFVRSEDDLIVSAKLFILLFRIQCRLLWPECCVHFIWPEQNQSPSINRTRPRARAQVGEDMWSGCGCVQENDRARSSEISFCHKMSMQGPVTFKLIQLVRCWLFVFYLLVSKSCTSAISCDSLHDTRGLPNCCFEPSVTRARICHGVGSAPVTARSTASTSCYISAISPAHVWNMCITVPRLQHESGIEQRVLLTARQK